MAQYDVYRNNDAKSLRQFPYLLDIQSNLHSNMVSRMVVPLAVDVPTVRHLTPVFEIEELNVVAYVMEMTSVPKSILVDRVTNVSQYRNQIVDALDFLVNGF